MLRTESTWPPLAGTNPQVLSQGPALAQLVWLFILVFVHPSIDSPNHSTSVH